MAGTGQRTNYTLFEQNVKIPTAGFDALVKKMRRSEELSEITKKATESELLKMIIVERHTKNRVFVVERLYIKFKKQRERREKIVLLTG
jgi:hypothetical protein